jgi:DNA-directed RNA polymerase subunit M
MDFCKKCHFLMVPIKKGKVTHLECRKCGYKQKGHVHELKIVEKVPKSRGVVLLEKDEVTLPIMDRTCPECGHEKAYYWLQQTRAADEPPTQFFRCVNCKHVWREYK